MLIFSKVVNSFMIMSGKQIRDQVVNFFVDIHTFDSGSTLKMEYLVIGMLI